ncbi:MAG: DUF4366 domain-containing protein [Candidatus Avilachnospira sp.]|jgi:hypothetical protein
MDRFNEKLSAFRQDTGDRIEEIIHGLKMKEIIEKNEEEEKTRKIIIAVFAIVGIVAAIAAISYAVYRFVTPDYLEDYEDDFDDDFLDSIDEKAEVPEEKAE